MSTLCPDLPLPSYLPVQDYLNRKNFLILNTAPSSAGSSPVSDRKTKRRTPHQKRFEQQIAPLYQQPAPNYLIESPSSVLRYYVPEADHDEFLSYLARNRQMKSPSYLQVFVPQNPSEVFFYFLELSFQFNLAEQICFAHEDAKEVVRIVCVAIQKILAEIYEGHLSAVFVRSTAPRSFHLLPPPTIDAPKLKSNNFKPPPPLSKVKVSPAITFRSSEILPNVVPIQNHPNTVETKKQKNLIRHEWSSQFFWRMLVKKPEALLVTKYVQQKLSTSLPFYTCPSLKLKLKFRWNEILSRNFVLFSPLSENATYRLSSRCIVMDRRKFPCYFCSVRFNPRCTMCRGTMVAQEDAFPYETLCWLDATGKAKPNQEIRNLFLSNPIFETWLSNILVKQEEGIESTECHLPEALVEESRIQRELKGVQDSEARSLLYDHPGGPPMVDLKQMTKEEREVFRLSGQSPRESVNHDLLEALQAELPKQHGRILVPRSEDYSAVYEIVERSIQGFQVASRPIPLQPFAKVKLDRILRNHKRTHWVCVVSGEGSGYCTNIMHAHPRKTKSTYFTFTRRGDLLQKCSVRGVAGRHGIACVNYESTHCNGATPNRLQNPTVLQILTTVRQAQVSQLNHNLGREEAKKHFSDWMMNKFSGTLKTKEIGLLTHMEMIGGIVYRIQRYRMKKNKQQQKQEERKAPSPAPSLPSRSSEEKKNSGEEKNRKRKLSTASTLSLGSFTSFSE